MELNEEKSDAGTRAFLDSEDNLKFHPPLYIQRYDAVKAILQDERWARDIKKVVEFGCAEITMFTRFKDLPEITKLVLVDIDPTVLEFYSCRAAPLNCDYLNPRKKPLCVDVLCGSVADCDIRTAGADAVVCIELIEHLYADVLEKLEFTIFGFIKPKIAVFTTPNSDFNVLLKGLGSNFRHADHKFEWSREEFKCWTDKILTQYPDYHVELGGVGNPPLGKEEVGCCSQVAVFVCDSESVHCDVEVGSEIYHVVRTYNHPVYSDNRTDEQKLINEIQYCLHLWSSWEAYQSEEEEAAYIPLCNVVDAVKKQAPNVDLQLVREIVESDNVDCDVIERDGVVLARYNLAPPSSPSCQEDYEHYDMDSEKDDQNYHVEEQEEEELWDEAGPPIFVEPMELVQIQRDIEDLSWARLENEVNLIRERERMLGESDNESQYTSDSDSDEYYWTPSLIDDCEKRWNHSAFRPPFSDHPYRKHSYSDGGNTSRSDAGNSSISDAGNISHINDRKTSSDAANASFSVVESVSNGTAECDMLDLSEKLHVASISKCEANENDFDVERKFHESTSCNKVPVEFQNQTHELIPEFGIDLVPHVNKPQPPDDEFEETQMVMNSNLNFSALPKPKEIPKSTSVEVLHLDGLPSLKRSAGMECVEFSPSSSVTLCYTGQTYHHSKKSRVLPFSPERKSLDGSLVHDVSLDIDQAGDSGYPNSSSLHHDMDVDLTPEQVDDISSENDEQSNQSISEDESDVSDGAPAGVCCILLPRRPVVPIMFENVENGDLANNNRDGEGNNAVPAPGDDEREFVALVEEGEMLPLMAAPIGEDIVLPDDADPYPGWLLNLLKIDEKVEEEVGRFTLLPSPSEEHYQKKLCAKSVSESDDEGLGADASCSWTDECNPREANDYYT